MRTVPTRQSKCLLSCVLRDARQHRARSQLMRESRNERLWKENRTQASKIPNRTPAEDVLCGWLLKCVFLGTHAESLDYHLDKRSHWRRAHLVYSGYCVCCCRNRHGPCGRARPSPGCGGSCVIEIRISLSYLRFGLLHHAGWHARKQ